MLAFTNDTITETGVQTCMNGTGGALTTTNAIYQTETGFLNTNLFYQPYGYWGSYPVYICTDKTKKAIDVLKALESEGLKVTSVKKFIELTEKIAAIL